MDPFDHFDYNEPLSVFPEPIYFSSPHLTRKFPNLEEIPENFFKVFINVSELNINVRVNCQSLIRFIKKLRNLEKLSVSENEFEEHFFHELSRIQSIRSLFLNRVFPAEADYDIGCIFNLRNIEYMQLSGHDSNIKISAKLFIEFLKATEDSSVTRAITISNVLTGKIIEIDHNTVCKYFLLWGVARDDKVELEFECLNELILLIEKLAEKDTIFI